MGERRRYSKNILLGECVPITEATSIRDLCVQIRSDCSCRLWKMWNKGVGKLLEESMFMIVQQLHYMVMYF